MNNNVKLCVNDMLYAISYALDCVEEELKGSTTYHSKRVACISTYIGIKIGLNKYEVIDLTTCALLHDNALTEYISDERNVKEAGENLDSKTSKMLRSHCLKGEENMKNVPTYGTITNVVKYHHEHVDGSGAFGVSYDEVPLFSKIIHMADQIDVLFDFSNINQEKLNSVNKHLEEKKGTIYCENIVDIFTQYADMDVLNRLADDELDNFLQSMVPELTREYDKKTIINLINVFAKIIDYKSQVTQRHSMGIAEKSYKMCEYYGFDEDTKMKFYMAAGLHDIGKLVVNKDVLEKPDKLTDVEFEHIKTHAYQTYKILSKIKNIEDVVDWASLHHEKLNGKGYPFGKKAEQLDDKCRLMACLDIYQALVEKRPYKDGFSHDKAIEILRDMAGKEFIDKSIVDDLDKVFCYNKAV